MTRRWLIAVGVLVAFLLFLGGDVFAADRPIFCGTQPWQSIIREAADRFDIPSPWIEAVILAESAGCATVNDKPITSTAGAMGLMQLMAATWSQYRARLDLGDDPFNAHDNILAGAAYLRDLYGRYGEAGFLAAYQAGPKRYEEYLRDGRPLPRATLDYIARVERGVMQIDARSFPLPSPVAPAASALFVSLTARPLNPGAALDRRLDTRLFVPLTHQRRSAQSTIR